MDDHSEETRVKSLRAIGLDVDEAWRSLAGAFHDGPNGLAEFEKEQKKIRRKMMPTGKVIAGEAMRKCGITQETLSSADAKAGFSRHLVDVSTEEFGIYNEYELKCSKSILARLLELQAMTLERVARNLQTETNTLQQAEPRYLSEAFKRFYTSLYPHLLAFYNSLLNSRKSRAGGSFEIQLGNLLRCSQYDYRLHKYKGPDGTLTDFILPNDEKLLQNHPRFCIGLSAKRTLRERWQNAVKELKSLGVGNIFICTLENGDHVPDQKVDEITREGITLVVTKDVKDARFASRREVISYEKLVNEALRLKLDYAAAFTDET